MTLRRPTSSVLRLPLRERLTPSEETLELGPVVPTSSDMLLESGDRILLEGGDALLLET
jgi:hypothetical protein